MSFIVALALALHGPAPLPPITAMAIAPGGELVLTGSQAGVQVRSLGDLTIQRTMATKLEHVHDLAFAPRGDFLAIAGGSPHERGTVEVWSWPQAELLQSFSAGDDLAYAVAWNREGSQIAIACADKSVRIQPIAGGTPRIVDAHSGAVLSVAWLETFVLSAGVDQTIRVLSANGKTLRSLDNHTAPVRELAVRPGEHGGPPMVASAGADRTVRLWQPTIGRLVRFARLRAAATAICWTPDGNRLVAACEDGVLRAIAPETVAVTALDSKAHGWPHTVAMADDGRFALVGGEAGQVWRVSLSSSPAP